MHFKKMAMRLIAAGVLGLIVGMFMDTTVATGYDSSMRVHNIGLQSRQQNILIISGILFLGGIILFATAKLKSSKEDEQAEEAAKAQARAARKAALEASADKALDQAGKAGGFLQRQFSLDQLGQRLPAGILIGLSLSVIGTGFRVSWWLTAAACILYSLRNAAPVRLTRHLLVVHTILYGLATALMAAIGVFGESVPLRFAAVMPAIPGVAALISAIWLFKIRKKSSEAQGVSNT